MTATPARSTTSPPTATAPSGQLAGGVLGLPSVLFCIVTGAAPLAVQFSSAGSNDPDGDPISQRANLPDDLPPDELTLEYAEKLFSTPQEGRVLGVDPATGHEIVAREGRFGPYVTELLPEPTPEPEPEPDVTPIPVEEVEAAGGGTKTATKKAVAKKAAKKAPAKKAAKKATGPKPRTASLLKTMDLSTVTLEDALRLLSLPSRVKRSRRRTAVTVRT